MPDTAPKSTARGARTARILASPLFFAATLCLLCLSQVALAGTAPPPPDQNASAWLQALYAAVIDKQWGIVAGVALIGLVYPLRLWGPDVFKTPLGGLALAFLVSLAGTLGITLAAGAAVSLQVAVAAVTTAATAAGLWEWIKAHLPGGAAAAAKAAVKSPSSMVVVLVAVFAMTACSGSAGQRAPAGVKAFLDCETPHVDAAMLADAKALATAAASKWISGSGTIDAAGLRADAAPLKTDLLRCAFDAAMAALVTAVSATPGAPASSARAVDSVQVTAAWSSARAQLGWPAQAPQ